MGIYGTVTQLLVDLGFQTRHRGYRYLRAAICMAYMYPHMLTSVTKCLYPAVAKCYIASDKQVERSIRNSVEMAWEEGNPAVLNEFFGAICDNGETRPTNTEVIGKVVEFLKECK